MRGDFVRGDLSVHRTVGLESWTHSSRCSGRNRFGLGNWGLGLELDLH